MIVDGGYVNLDLTEPKERKKKCDRRKAQTTKPRKKNGRKKSRVVEEKAVHEKPMVVDEAPMREEMDKEPCQKRPKLLDEECEEHEAQCRGYICGTCGDTFTVKTKYILHERQCKGKTKHQCMICCDLKSEKEMKLTQCCDQMKACNDCTDRAYEESNTCMWCRHFTKPTRLGKRKRE
jgi:hypothetical protein